MPTVPPDFEHCDVLHAYLWRRLSAVASDRDAPFRLATFSTITDGGSPASRQVVIRTVDSAARRLTFHTDRRSAKMREIAAEPRVALLFWDAASRTQLRLAARARHVEDTSVIDAFLATAPPGTLAVYRSRTAPGTPISSCDAIDLAAEPILDHVALIEVTIDMLEWLWLDDAGHRRCRFTYVGDRYTHEWLAP